MPGTVESLQLDLVRGPVGDLDYGAVVKAVEQDGQIVLGICGTRLIGARISKQSFDEYVKNDTLHLLK